MKRYLVLIMLALSSMSIFAYDFKVGGICYNVISRSSMTVEVTYERIWDNSAYGYPYRCTYIGNVNIPEYVDYAGDRYSVTKIGEYAFCTSPSSNLKEYMKNLKSINLPSTITTIGQNAFYMCDELSSLIIPSSITQVGDQSFWCRNIQWIAFLSPNPPSIVTGGGIASSIQSFLVPQQTEFWVPSKKNYSKVNDYSNFTLIEMLTPDSRSFEYNGQIPTIEWTNNLSGYTMNVSNGTLQKDAGAHSTDVKADFYKDDELEFSVEFPYEYTINKATLNAKVNNASREYGEVNPSFSVTYSGFVNNEDESVITTEPTLSSTATKTSNVGTYRINGSGGSALNYNFVCEPGVLTVTKAPLSAMVNDATKVYGSNNPSFSLTYTGLKNNETVPTWTSSPTFSTSASKTSEVGTYEVTANCVAKNYDVTVTPGTLTITSAPLTLKANNASRLYFEDNPEFSFTCSGFQNSETTSVITTLPSFTTDAVKTSNAGTYTIAPSGAYAKNYSITYQTGVLTINKRNLTATPDNKSRLYGDANPDFTISYSGFVNNDTESSLSEIPLATTSVTPTSTVGDYTISLNGGSATNYNLVLKTGVLTVTKAPLSAMVNDAAKEYGLDNPSFTINYYGLKNEETVPAWTTSPSFQTEATKQSGVGQYTVNAINGVAKNYDLGEITSGTLTITPAPLTIKANNATKLYYNDNPTLSYTCSGFMNSDNESVLSPAPTLSTTATQSSNVGTYEISVEGASSPNYSISYINGNLTVTPRTLMVSVGNYERIYNEDNPEFEVTYEGFVGNEDKNNLNETPVASTTATKTSDVGTYQIKVSGGSADNYTFSYTSGTLTINKAEQTIAWNQDLSNLNVGDQVELQAVASSGLPITYTMDDNGVAEIYSTGSKYYLDCLSEGQFTIRAVQNGNNNYYPSPRASRRVSISSGSSSTSDLTLTINQADNGTISMPVIKGKAYTFTIAPNYGWKIHTVMFNNSDVTTQLSNDGKYTTPAINNNSWLSVVYESIDEDAIASNAESNVKIQGTSFGARVLDAELGNMIRVYTVDGKLQSSLMVDSSSVDVPLEKDNIYIIQVGAKTVKLGH